jgi:hypothetical protein
MNKTIIMGLMIGAIVAVMTAPQIMTNVAYVATAGCTGPFALVCVIAIPGFAKACAGALPCLTVGTPR